MLTIFRESPIEDYEQKIAEITKHYGVTRNLLERWIRNSENLAGPKLPEDMLERLKYLIDKTTIRIAEKLDDGESNLRDLVIAYGILVDKQRILNGESTQNIEQHFSFARSGLSTIPEHLAPKPDDNAGGAQEIQRHQLRAPVG